MSKNLRREIFQKSQKAKKIDGGLAGFGIARFCKCAKKFLAAAETGIYDCCVLSDLIDSIWLVAFYNNHNDLPLPKRKEGRYHPTNMKQNKTENTATEN